MRWSNIVFGASQQRKNFTQWLPGFHLSIRPTDHMKACPKLLQISLKAHWQLSTSTTQDEPNGFQSRATYGWPEISWIWFVNETAVPEASWLSRNRNLHEPDNGSHRTEAKIWKVFQVRKYQTFQRKRDERSKNLESFGQITENERPTKSASKRSGKPESILLWNGTTFKARSKTADSWE